MDLACTIDLNERPREPECETVIGRTKSWGRLMWGTFRSCHHPDRGFSFIMISGTRFGFSWNWS